MTTNFAGVGVMSSHAFFVTIREHNAQGAQFGNASAVLTANFSANIKAPKIGSMQTLVMFI